MQTAPSMQSPIAIGGLGGSGTRVFAALLQAAGVHIGDCLNQPLDNLWFAVLFKRAAWCRPSAPRIPDPADVLTSIRLFHRAMSTGLVDDLSPAEKSLLEQLRGDLPPNGTWQCGPQAPHADSLISSGPASGQADRRWGWKEPNTHVFLPHLDRYFSGFRYIHIVRDGLDMAFSKNTWQARHWGHLYGLSRKPDVPLPLHQLQYWSAANRVALDYGRTHMQGRFLVVDYEDFCAQPVIHWARILRFLGLDDGRALPKDLVQPMTIGRSASHDLSIFPEPSLAEARALQAVVEIIGKPS